ncbi:excalibur calcium-binding domain-containing protein [Motilibacter rhizosphaerae]|uniref:Excalibur calcium-binding domain-containing protein n=1 Tax=Motilibacter rhizosphaerae TaxID=598652 RepID=A0A4V2F4N0_9ACTN|nr:DUF1524 domain-containing protein [Motilibacter rhizosphaerae]RZS89889.1 excalibur calcium-binding domain-containing protein [Motilibacter rhizosphaerae]
MRKPLPSARLTLAAAALSVAVVLAAPLLASGPGASAATASASSTLAGLSVKGRAPLTDYSRSQFGPAWADVDRNGCDTRNDILKRDLKTVTFRAGTRNCVVLTGTLTDPYTGKQLAFLKARASAVQIDHVVALGDAWQTGGQQWDASRRLTFANDPLNLLAVSEAANEAKGDKDAASWLPPSKPFRCSYVARQVAVKAKYGLWMTAAEKAASARVLANCSGQTLPRGGVGLPRPVVSTPAVVPGPVVNPTPTLPPQPVPPVYVPPQPAQTTEAPAPVVVVVPPPADPAPVTTAPAVAATTPPPPAADVYYANCDAVRAAGAAPLYRGQPGYRPGLDRDGDGVACE